MFRGENLTISELPLMKKRIEERIGVSVKLKKPVGNVIPIEPKNKPANLYIEPAYYITIGKSSYHWGYKLLRGRELLFKLLEEGADHKIIKEVIKTNKLVKSKTEDLYR